MWGVKVEDVEHPWPATFLVGKGGRIRWRFIADEHRDWPTLYELRDALRDTP